MKWDEIFNLQNLFPGNDAELRARFESAVPYPHAVLPNAISTEFGHRLFEAFESFPYRWRRVQESFYEHEVCNLLDLARHIGGELQKLVNALQEPDLVERLCNFAGVSQSTLMYFTGHRLYHGDRIDTHNDDNAFGETFRLLLFPEPGPKFSGGVLLLQEKANGQAFTRLEVPYIPFQAYLFRFGLHSHHAVTPVQGHTPDANRLTLLATYGVEP
jgi:hypothetical protein